MSAYSKEDISLFYTEAKQARDRAYCPYSAHPVGVVLIDDLGHKSLGCNTEVAHFKSMCAEAGAISHMIVQGGQKIRDIFIVGPADDPVTPCGDCRQRIREFADDSTGIYCFGSNGIIVKQYTIGDLLPDSFGPENILNRKPQP
jgi:cytidine deaminase